MPQTHTHTDVGTWEQNEFWMPLEVQKPINGKKSQRHFSPTSNAEGRDHFVKEVFLQLTQEQHTHTHSIGAAELSLLQKGCPILSPSQGAHCI